MPKPCQNHTEAQQPACEMLHCLQTCALHQRADSSVVERLAYTELVGGSNPSPRTIFRLNEAETENRIKLNAAH
jgi:hypothetical protein